MMLQKGNYYNAGEGGSLDHLYPGGAGGSLDVCPVLIQRVVHHS